MTLLLAADGLFLAAVLCFCAAAVYRAEARLALAAALAIQVEARQAQADAEALQRRALDVLAVAEEHVVAEELPEWI